MSDLHHDQPHNQLQRVQQKHDESNTMLAILMAGIAALFIAGIALTFNFARDSETTQSAQSPNPPAASAPSTTGSAASTTGSGGINRNPPARDPRENEQTERDPSGRPLPE